MQCIALTRHVDCYKPSKTAPNITMPKPDLFLSSSRRKSKKRYCSSCRIKHYYRVSRSSHNPQSSPASFTCPRDPPRRPKPCVRSELIRCICMFLLRRPPLCVVSNQTLDRVHTASHECHSYHLAWRAPSSCVFAQPRFAQSIEIVAQLSLNAGNRSRDVEKRLQSSQQFNRFLARGYRAAHSSSLTLSMLTVGEASRERSVKVALIGAEEVLRTRPGVE